MEKFPLLDIVIGLSLIYTCLSLLASELAEFVITRLQWRTRCLKQSIITLLGEPLSRGDSEQFKVTIASKLLNNSRIVSGVQACDRRNGLIMLSNVMPHLFAEALLDVLQGLPAQGLPLSNALTTNHSNAAAKPIIHLKSIVEFSPDLPPQLRINLRRIIDRVQRVEPNANRQMLRLTDAMGHWFSYATIDALAVYKQQFKIISFLVSLALVIAMNVDSLYIIRRISENTATQAVIIQNATQIQACQDHLSSPNCVERLSFLMEHTTIPIGWQPSNRQRQFAQLNGVTILRTIAGWFLTSIAVAMGSRFWLQLLNQLGFILGGKRKSRPSTPSVTFRRDRRYSSAQSMKYRNEPE